MSRVRDAWLVLRGVPTCSCGHHPVHAALAWQDLAEVAYGSRSAVWTSHRTLVKTALRIAAERGSADPRMRAAFDPLNTTDERTEARP